MLDEELEPSYACLLHRLERVRESLGEELAEERTEHEQAGVDVSTT